jgi:hypothetical protein
VDADRVDLGGFSVAVGGRDLLAVGRVDRAVVVGGVVGKLNPILSVDADRVDLIVVSV